MGEARFCYAIDKRKNKFKPSHLIEMAMTWLKYEVGNPRQRPRPVAISRNLFQALKKFSEDKNMKKQQCFDIALTSLWRIWNDNTDTVEPANAVTQLRVKNILINNSQPNDVCKDGKKYYVHIVFKGEKTFSFVNELERLYFIRGIEDGVKRILSWFLREQGYLDPVNERKKDQNENKLDHIDIVI